MVDAPPRELAVTLIAAAVGFGLTLFAVRMRGRSRQLVAYASGISLGAGAGLLLYVVGYVVALSPGFPASPTAVGALMWAALTGPTLVGAFCTVLGAALGFLTARYTWRIEGLVAYVALVSVVAGYLIYAGTVTVPRVPREHLPLTLVLLVAEVASLSMVVLYAFYGLDLFMKRRWRRSAEQVPFSRYYVPKVAFHVTVFNEPTALVTETLDALERLDYPPDRRVVMVLDDSTDAVLRAALSAHCASRGFQYIHRADRRGFKAGALNHALTLTPEDVELVAVIDADYQVEPEYLRETVGYFINPNLAFVQTPQDYRNVHQSFLTRQYYFADGYFYRAVLPSRNEENTIIFCGTMGLIRKRVLARVGGWGERFITEDAELSVRVLELGYDSLYVNKTYGKGLIPSTFQAYKKQQYRWSFGSIKILKAHFRKFLVSRMTVRQKLDYLVGNLHWFDGVYVLAIATSLGIVGVAEGLGWDVITHHQGEVWLVGLVPFFLLIDGVLRLHVALRQSMHLTLSETVKVMGIWFAIKFNNMFAALKSLVGFQLPFVRTPKAPGGRPGRWEAVGLAFRLTKFESLMALALLSIAMLNAGRTVAAGAAGGLLPSRVLLSFWLLHYAAIFFAAPLYAYKSYVTYIPERELFPAPRRAEPAREAAH